VWVPSQSRWSSKSSILNPEKPNGPVWEIVLSGLAAATNWSWHMSWPLSSLLGPCFALLPPPLDPSSRRASLRHWPKSRSLARSASGYFLIHQQRIRLFVPLDYAGDQELLMSSRKPDGLVWHSRLFGFHVLVPSCPTDGRRSRSGHLLRSSLHGQNLQLVLTILSESASAVESMDRTTPPMVDKVDTSSVEVPMSRALVARLGSKVSDGAHIDDDPDLLNLTVVVS
jgi:hypothetical protein